MLMVILGFCKKCGAPWYGPRKFNHPEEKPVILRACECQTSATMPILDVEVETYFRSKGVQMRIVRIVREAVLDYAVKTVGDFLNLTRENLLYLRDCADISADAIEAALRQDGLKLREGSPLEHTRYGLAP